MSKSGSDNLGGDDGRAALGAAIKAEDEFLRYVDGLRIKTVRDLEFYVYNLISTPTIRLYCFNAWSKLICCQPLAGHRQWFQFAAISF